MAGWALQTVWIQIRKDIQISSLGWIHTSTKESQCMIHHALQDQAQPCGNYCLLHLMQLSKMPKHQKEQTVYKNSFPPLSFGITSPQDIVEQLILKHFQSALGQSTANN